VNNGIMAGWIRIPLGTEVHLGPGDIVLDGDSPPPHGKGHSNSEMSVVYLSLAWTLDKFRN